MTGRHRGDGRPRTLLRASFAAAVLVLAVGMGAKLGALVEYLDAQDRVVQVAQCTEEPR